MIRHVFEEKPVETFVAAPPLPLPNLTANGWKVLRLVKSGDPYRDKGRGRIGRAARNKVLERLRELGLIRTLATEPTFWRVTGRGKELLGANPIKR